MTTHELYVLLELPQEAVDRLDACAQTDMGWLTGEMKARYLTRATSGDGLKAIEAHLGDDPDGLRLLWVLLELARETADGYARMGVDMRIFAETMKCFAGFLRQGMERFGHYCFHWGWRSWQVLAMLEFGFGCLTYELVEHAEGNREIRLHIAADADLCPASVNASFASFYAFLREKYPQWQEAPWVWEGWMVCPELEYLMERVFPMHYALLDNKEY